MEKTNFLITADQAGAAGIDITKIDDSLAYKELRGELEQRAEALRNAAGETALKMMTNLQAEISAYNEMAQMDGVNTVDIEDFIKTDDSDSVDAASEPTDQQGLATVVPIDRASGDNRNGVKIISAVAGGLIGSIALAACGTSGNVTPAPTPTVSVSPSASPSTSPSASPFPNNTITVSPTPNATPTSTQTTPNQQPTTPTTPEQQKQAEREARDKADAEFFGVSLEQLQEFRKDHGFKDDTQFFTAEATKLMRDDKGNKANGMESNLAIGEKLCVDKGTTAKECAAELKLAAGANYLLAPYLQSETSGKGGFNSAYENRLVEIYKENPDTWRKDVAKFVKESIDLSWKLKKLNPSESRLTHSMSARHPGKISVLRYAQDGDRLVAYDKNGKEVLGVRVECEQGTEAGRLIVPSKPHNPGKPDEPHNPTPKPKDQRENPIQGGKSTKDNGGDNAKVDNGTKDTDGTEGNEKQPDEPKVDWKS